MRASTRDQAEAHVQPRFLPNLPSDRSGFARCLVGERDRFEILDPWIVAVTRANPVAPGAAVEGVSGGLAFPHINATGDVAFFPADELLSDEAGGLSGNPARSW